jgi:hypothetical protein
MKSFTQKAIYSALAGSSLMLASGAGAVNVNNDGMGEVLLYPYYTVRNGATTLMTVVNTTTTAKAVKIRINEGKNSAEVLDFNLWLSAKDVWTAAIVATADGAGITTTDKSCTNPKVTGTVAFRNNAYATDNAALRTLDRTREGYIEVIEMATVAPLTKTEADVTHGSDGVPECTLVSNAAVISRLADYDDPTGGLFGSGTLVTAGQATGYNATAIEGFGYNQGVTASGTVFPNLNSGTNLTAVVVDSLGTGSSRITAANFGAGRGVDAVSAVIMHSSVMGEYGFDATFGTDWVITMPTKRFYVNGVVPRAPFQRIWNGTSSTGNGTACVDITIDSYDREEGSSTVDDDFSPTGETGIPQLCWEATVVSFGSGPATASGVVGSTNLSRFNAFQATGTSGGWAELTFGNANSNPAFTPRLGALPTSQTTIVSATGIGAPVVGAVTFTGLPAIGFSVISATFPGATNLNFNSSFNLNFRRSITAL